MSPCSWGVGVDGQCVRYNSCLDNIEHCDSCDNAYNPNKCKICKGHRYIDTLTDTCKENVCACHNGQLGDCAIHNRFDCTSCDYGYAMKISGENKMCESCGLNEEPNDARTYCIPCSKNYEKAAGSTGYCTKCPFHTVRNGEQSCMLGC